MKILSKFFTEIRNRALVWDTITTSFWVTLGKAVGFLIPFFIAAWYGVTVETDAFFFVYGLVLFMAGIFASMVTIVIVPYVAELKAEYQDIGNFVGNILSLSGLGLLILSILFLLVCRLILPFVTKFSSNSLELIYLLLLEIVPLIVLLAWTSILSGTLNTYKKFIFPAISPAIRAIICLGVIFIFKDKIGVHSVALGYVVGEIFRFVFLACVIRYLKIFKLKFFLQFNPKLWEFFKTSSYQIIGTAAFGFKPVADRMMASWLGEGSVSVLYYADRLYMIPIIFIIDGLAVVILSHWSNRFYKSEIKGLRQDVKNVETVVVLIAFLILVILFMFNRQIVNIAFSRGAFDRAKLSEVAMVFKCFLIGFVPLAWVQIYMRGFIVVKNTKIIMKCAIFMNLLTIVLNFVLMQFFKVVGIALASSFVSVFSLVYLRGKFYKLTGKQEEGNHELP